MRFDMPSCGGCRTCELACSFHQTGEFGYTASSLRIIEKVDHNGMTVELPEKDDGERIACDRCEGLDVPLCVEWCREPDDLMAFVIQFTPKVKPGA